MNYDRQTLIEIETKLEALEYKLDHCLNEYIEPSKFDLELREHYLDRIKELTNLINKKD